MLLSATMVMAGLLAILVFSNSVPHLEDDKNSSFQLPALGPIEARPQAYNIEFGTNDKTYALNNFKGKVIYLNFWATWCEPCKEELPLIESLQKKYGQEQFIVILVNLDHPDEFPVANKMRMKLAPSVFEIYDTDTLRTLFNVNALPMHVLIDKNGRTAISFYNRVDNKAEAFENLIKELLSEN
jgi:thiol-disulfide isomerase/thioredoxin